MKTASKDGPSLGPESMVVASFARGLHDYFARALENRGLLAFLALGTRRGTKGVSGPHTRLNPVFGLLNYIAGKSLPPFQAETCRFRLYPLFDRWVRSQLRPGQHLLTSFAFANSSMKWVKERGGSTFLDAENSHPRLFWELLSEEQKRWESPDPPVAPFYNQRCRETVDLSDYVFAASPFVRDSFLDQGWDPQRVLLYSLPVNLDLFKPAPTPRPESRPLTLLNTGALCLRKGTPYLLEAFRLIRKQEPRAVLRLTQTIRADAKPALRRFADLPIDWAPSFNLGIDEQRQRYLERFQTSDIFVFPTIEEGFAVVVKEALACGLPVITTRHSGASDVIQPGENGELVPIRDPQATADAVLKWWSKIREGKLPQNLQRSRGLLSFESFEETIMNHLRALGTLPGA
jgi:glycosyltransferase involved in cell wall biosynthesis